MRKVVDSNYLQSEDLNNYLSASQNSQAVIIDYVAIEAYKGNTLKSIYKSISVLSKYPNQVVILKGTQTICGLKPKNKGMQKRYIDTSQTRDFSTYCKHIALTESGNKKYQNAILKHGKYANSHINKMILNAEGIIESIVDASSSYTSAELEILRKQLPYTDEIAHKLINHVLLLTDQLLKYYPSNVRPTKFNDLASSYLFRYSLSIYLLVIHWISEGGVKGVKPERMNNDVIDMHFVAYGTVFDGLLTNDKKAEAIYDTVSYLLKSTFNK